MENALLRQKYHDYRRLMDVRAEDPTPSGDLILKGTPIIFDKEYELFKFRGKTVYEIVHRKAFDNADYRDVPLKYNHDDGHGTPARTTARGERGKITFTVLEDRVDVVMNLLPTSGGKDLYEEVRAGTVPQMSWAFTQEESSQSVEEFEDRIVFHINAVERVFDISAVDFGQNEKTTIYARRLGDLDERAKQLDELACQALIDKIIKLS